MRIRPVGRDEANRWLGEVHRHLRRPIAGWLFGVEILDDDGARIGVAVCGRPAARMLQDGVTCEIRRVAIADGHHNACSFAYGALRRAATSLGYTRVYTYTRQDETGASVRAAGFVFDGEAGGGEATRPSRPRAASEDPSPKNRWVWPASARHLGQEVTSG